MARMTARERRESYLREHAYQKKTGKPFFPAAIFHDVVVNLFFVLLIIVLAIVWYTTATHGPDGTHGGGNGALGPLYEDKANPAVESYDPRPEWYFFFLFQLLRIFSNPNLILLGSIIVPTIWMIILIGIPFFDHNRDRRLSKRPVAIAFGTGMAILLLALTWKGSVAPGAVGKQSPLGVQMSGLSCSTCHSLADAGWTASGPGPNLDQRKPTYQKAMDRITNGKGVMPSFKGNFDAKKIQCIATYVASTTNGGTPVDNKKAAGGAPSSPDQACAGVAIP